MAAVTIHSDFRTQEEASINTSIFFPSICHESNGARCHDLGFTKPALSLSFTLIKRLFSTSSLAAIRVVSSAYLRLLMFLPHILIPACNSSSPAFLMMCSAYRLNKQGDSRQPCHTPFLIFNQSVLTYRVLTVVLDLHTDFSGDRQDGLIFRLLYIILNKIYEPVYGTSPYWFS